MEMKQHELEWKEIGKAEGLAEGKAEERRSGAVKLYRKVLELIGSSEQAIQAVHDGYPEFTPEEIEEIISETEADQ